MTVKLVNHASLLALSLALAGCGGGGSGDVNSTPTPTPTSTPNTDLIGPLRSESFTNTAASAAVKFASNGNLLSQTRAKPNATFAYDAASNSYKVTAAGVSQTFAPGNLVDGAYYQVTSGKTTDVLSLTPTGPSSGLTFQYVGAAFWQRQAQHDAGIIDGSLTSFVYGVPTATLVRTGQIGYALNIYGALSDNGNLFSLIGDGKMVGDLASGTLRPSGTVLYYDARTGTGVGLGSFIGELTLSSTANSLTGRFGLQAFGRSYAGTADGMFFGPQAQEVGASFTAADVNGNVAAGAFLGRNDPGLAILPFDQQTARTSYEVHYFGQNLGQALNYDPTSKTYTIDASSLPNLSYTSPSFYDTFSQFTLGPTQVAATQTEPNFVQYEGSVDGRALKAQFYKTGTANSEIQLSYLSFYRLEIASRSADTGPDLRYALYGTPTPSDMMPTTGTARYVGPVYGTGEYSNGAKAYTVTGQSSFDVNFASGASGSGKLDLQLASVATGVVTPMTVAIQIGNSRISTGASANGYTSQQFFGTNAQELGVTFGFMQDMVAISGVTVAKRQ